MAKWRALHADITTSPQVDKLTEFEQLLFTWMIPHADDWGVISGNPRALKLKVLPGSDRSLQEISGAVRHIQEVGLIWWYQPDGHDALIQFREWDKHQPIREDRRKDPEWPIYDEKHPCPSMSGNDGQCQTKTGYTRQDNTILDKTPPTEGTRKRDHRLDHGAITGYKEIARLHVPIPLRDDWIKCADEVGVDYLLESVKLWIGNGWNKQNVNGIMDWSREGRPRRGTRGKDSLKRKRREAGGGLDKEDREYFRQLESG